MPAAVLTTLRGAGIQSAERQPAGSAGRRLFPKVRQPAALPVCQSMAAGGPGRRAEEVRLPGGDEARPDLARLRQLPESGARCASPAKQGVTLAARNLRIWRVRGAEALV